MKALTASLLLGTCILANAADPATLADLQRAFERPPDDARIMMRWWWFGAAVTKPELEREMRLMKEGGIGGFEVQPVYPLALDDPETGFRNLPYPSTDFLDALQFTGQKAKELGLRMDLTLASGWPYGGPHIPITQAAAKLRVERRMPALGAGEKLIAQIQGQYFIAGRTGQTVKRPAVGAEGFVLDHYDRSAIDTHLKVVGEKLLGALKNTPPYAVFSDSLEVYGNDWTGDLLAEFKKRRGYDLTPRLPELVNGNGDVRHDWGKTLTELANERYLTPIAEWAHQHGTRFRSQTYGTPPVSLSSNALVDLPEGEGSTWRAFSATRWASSASHLYGRPVTSSETWTWLHSPVFRATPLDMKAEADLHFLQGVNQLIGHGWPYSPESAGEPGWRFYAAAVFNQHNPWWLVMPDITRYLQRVSFVLRQGQPENDVALYLPTDDAWARFTPGKISINQLMDQLLGRTLIPAILDAGYNFDFIDDEAIARNGIKHRILILPKTERMPDATRKTIAEFAQKGGILAQEDEIGSLHARLAPDVATAPEIGVVHRKLDFGDLYFLVNTSNQPLRANATFRVKGLTPAWWNPLTGRVAPVVPATNSIALDLAPYESVVVVFSKQAAPPKLTKALPDTPIDLSTGWKVIFDNGPEMEMQQLRSWTDDDRTKYFTGTATYEKTLTVPQRLAGSAARLDFGEGTSVTPGAERRSGNGMRAWLEGPVREAAVVYVNGQRAGSVWCPPYQVNVGNLLHAGENQIRIVVANLAINKLAQGPLPDYKLLNALYGMRFQAQDLENLQPVPSGLLGSIRLVAH